MLYQRVQTVHQGKSCFGNRPSPIPWVTRATLITEVGPVGLIWVIMPGLSFFCRASAFSTPANGTNQSLYPVWFAANVTFLTVLFMKDLKRQFLQSEVLVYGEHFLRMIKREKSFKSPQNHLARKAETCMKAFSVSLDSSLFKS